MIEKHKCDKCDHLATWYYLPAGTDYYYCDNCIPRGCSCNLVYTEDENSNQIETEEYYKDEKGRPLPCCEYMEDTEGFELLDSESTADKI